MIIEFKGLACSDFTVEVRRGRTSDKSLFISYCSASDVDSIIATKASTLYIKIAMAEDAIETGTTFGSWTTEDCKERFLISLNVC